MKERKRDNEIGRESETEEKREKGRDSESD